MKIAVVGSRNFNDYELLKEFLDQENITHLISGGAPGADTLAVDYAIENNIPYTIHYAKWDDLSHPNAVIKVNKGGKKYDALAGFRRNTAIVKDCDKLIAFHDSASKGTLDSMEKAYKYKKKIKIIKYLML